MGGDDLAQIGINQTLHDIAYGFLQHGFHRSTLRLKQASVVLALQRRDRCGIANMALTDRHHPLQNLSANPVSLNALKVNEIRYSFCSHHVQALHKLLIDQ